MIVPWRVIILRIPISKKHKHTFSNRFPRTKNCPIFGSDERVFHAQRGSTGKRELRIFSRW